MMIRAFADAGRIFKNDAYTQTAAKAADFALAKLRPSPITKPNSMPTSPTTLN